MKLIRNMLITSVGLVFASSNVFAKNDNTKMEVSFQILESCIVKPDINIIKSIKDIKNISVNIAGVCSGKSSFIVVSEKLKHNRVIDSFSLGNDGLITIGKDESIIVNIVY